MSINLEEVSEVLKASFEPDPVGPVTEAVNKIVVKYIAQAAVEWSARMNKTMSEAIRIQKKAAFEECLAQIPEASEMEGITNPYNEPEIDWDEALKEEVEKK